jgi:tetratricopeptide (TPR) repeat protein
VPDSPRIEELRRRVQRDPASIAFAQLAEEYRRAGRSADAVETCRAGLSHHPDYLSARVTLGRALIETGDLTTAESELERVLAAAPENLAALKGLAEIHHRTGDLPKALEYYRSALGFAPHDPDLEHLIEKIEKELEPNQPLPVVERGLSFEEAMGEFAAFGAEPRPADPARTPGQALDDDRTGPITVIPESGPSLADPAEPAVPPAPSLASVEPIVGLASVPARQIETLERWLDVILAERDRRV